MEKGPGDVVESIVGPFLMLYKIFSYLLAGTSIPNVRSDVSGDCAFVDGENSRYNRVNRYKGRWYGSLERLCSEIVTMNVELGWPGEFVDVVVVVLMALDMFEFVRGS